MSSADRLVSRDLLERMSGVAAAQERGALDKAVSVLLTATPTPDRYEDCAEGIEQLAACAEALARRAAHHVGAGHRPVYAREALAELRGVLALAEELAGVLLAALPAKTGAEAG